MILIDGFEGFFEHTVGRIGDEADDIVVGGGPVALEGQKIVAASGDDRVGNHALGTHGVERDQCTGQLQSLEEMRDSCDLIRFGLGRLLTQDKALAGRPCGNHVQRLAALTSIMTAPGGLATTAIFSGAQSRRASTQLVKHDLKSSASSALITSFKVSWAGIPRSYGRKRRKKSNRSSPHSLVSPKSSIPLNVAHKTRSRISRSG